MLFYEDGFAIKKPTKVWYAIKQKRLKRNGNLFIKIPEVQYNTWNEVWATFEKNSLEKRRKKTRKMWLFSPTYHFVYS